MAVTPIPADYVQGQAPALDAGRLNAHATRTNDNTSAIEEVDTALSAKVDKTVVTAKGDIVVGSAPGTVVVLPVTGSSNGDVVTRDSSAPRGVKWAAPTGGTGTSGGSSGLVVDGDGLLAFTDDPTVDGATVIDETLPVSKIVGNAAAAVGAFLRKDGVWTVPSGGGGGGGGITDVVQDTTPQLGGDLDPNGHLVGAATAADLTKLHAVTATAAQLNRVDATSPIQAQLDGKQPTDTDLTAFAALNPTDDDIAQRKAGAWTNRTPAQLKTDLAIAAADVAGLAAAISSGITTWVGLAPGTLDTLAEIDAALGNDPNFATTMATALAGKQPLDATLTALAALTTAGNKLIYATGVDTFATADLTAAGRAILDDADAAAQRVTLGLVIGSAVQAWSAALDTWATKTTPGGTVVGTTDVQTITGKRITPRVNSSASNATPVLDATYDATVLTAQAAAITAFSLSNAFTAEQKHMIRIKDSGTARAITWTSTVIVAADGITLPTTTVVGKTHRIGCIYDEIVGKLIAVAVGTY